MQEITAKQKQILDFVRKQIEAKGQTPTVREIGAAVGLSSSCSVKKHLDVLELKGHIKRDRYKRGMDLLEDGEPLSMARSIGVPLLGTVAGGCPILAFQDPDAEILAVPVSLLSRADQHGRDLFALTVKGDSMRDAGITSGDVIIARRQQSAHNGEIVVALLEDEATVKTYYKESDHIRLQPENDAFEPIIARDVELMGKVVMAIKRF
jgi:repressor LexA